MKNSVLLFLIVVAVLTVQCSKETRVPNDLEKYLIKRLQAKDVSISVIQSSTTSDGMTTSENYLLVTIDKPKQILGTKFNQRLYNENCMVLSNFLIDSVKFDPQWTFDEVRLKIIEKDKFLIFTDEKYDIKSYRVR